MPIYAYKCESCGHRQDVLQKISDPVLSTCPACGAAAYVKQLTSAGFQLKGSGWYATDFRGGQVAPADDKADAKPADAPATPPVQSTTPPAAAAPVTPAPAADKARPSASEPG